MKPDSSVPAPRPWKGVVFHCCGAYGRVYQNRDGSWRGFCPRCGRGTVLNLLWMLVAFVMLLTPSLAQAQEKAGFSAFVQPGVQFLGFDDRSRFQTAIDTIYANYRAAAGEDSAKVTKQDFQKVNFAFPVYAGLQWRIDSTHSFALAAGWFHNREAVVISEVTGDLHEYYYVLQGFPLYAEYRMAISPKLISLSDHSDFSILLRWYWFLPGTEIYSSWGRVGAESDWKGNGWGLSLGYHIGTWKYFSVFGDMGFTSVSVRSNDTWNQVVPDTTSSRARWDLGGIQLQLRTSFSPGS